MTRRASPDQHGRGPPPGCAEKVASLAAVRPGEQVEVVRLLTRPAGDPHHHLRPGRRWSCAYSGSAALLLVGQHGETISVSVDTARYVEVRRVGADFSRDMTR
jgi:hypothetical protein